VSKKAKKFLWIHYLYAVIVILALGASLYLKPSVLYAVATGSVALVVITSCLLHYKNRDLKRDTLIEYLLMSLAVVVVLLSAARS
jgi:hypothetical protein